MKITINADRQEVFRDDKKIKLTPREFSLFLALKNSGNTLSRKGILTKVWKIPASIKYDSRTVDQHVARLRRKLGNDAIETSTTFGYRIGAAMYQG